MAIQPGPDASVLIEEGELRVRSELADGVQTLSLSGELDMSNADVLSQEVKRGIEADARIVIDLSALQFIDSAGIHRLVKATEELGGTDRLGVTRPPPDIARLFAVTGVDSMLPFVDELEA